MPSETPKPPNRYASWVDWAIADSSLSGSPHHALRLARAELAELREALKGANHAAATAAGILDENKRLREQLKQARNAALDEAADECNRRRELQVADAEYVAACQLRDAANAILSLKGA